MNDINLLKLVGEQLFGPQWMTSLANATHVSDRSMRRWANGTDLIPRGVFLDLAHLVEERLKSLPEIYEQLYQRTLVVPPDEGRPHFDHATKWYMEVHDPESGRHSCKQFGAFHSLSEIKSEMKRHPGMMFRIIMPDQVSDAERNEFERMNLRRL